LLVFGYLANVYKLRQGDTATVNILVTYVTKTVDDILLHTLKLRRRLEPEKLFI
jgi:hypothetical protein